MSRFQQGIGQGASTHLKKVKAHGIDDKVYNQIKAWLRGSEQRIQINGKISNCGAVNSGVHQGSILGPLIFIIYINYLDFEMSSNISKFADDIQIGRQISWD